MEDTKKENQEDTTEDTSAAMKALKTVGRGLATAGIFIGKQAAGAYNSIDPDVQRHLIQLPLLSYSLFYRRQAEIEAGEPDGHPPLILVHGLAGNPGTFLLMSWYFWLAGRKRTYRIAFDSGQTIDQQAKALAAFVRKVLKVTGEKQVDIAAHSMGGIVARLAIQEKRLGKAVKTVVFMGTPHKGTYPARYANTEVTKDLRPDSALIRRVNSKSLPPAVRGVSMWSSNDLFVLPADSAALEGTEQIEMTPFTHYSYLIDPKSWSAVYKALAGPEQ